MVGMVSDTLASDQGPTLLSLYDSALPQVYGYLASRCGSATVAEDLTSETFLAAVDAVRRGAVPALTVAWLIRVSRPNLPDPWLRRARVPRRPHAGDRPPDPDP